MRTREGSFVSLFCFCLLFSLIAKTSKADNNYNVIDTHTLTLNQTFDGSVDPCSGLLFSLSTSTPGGNYSIAQITLEASSHLVLSVASNTDIFLESNTLQPQRHCHANDNITNTNSCTVYILCSFHLINEWFVLITSASDNTASFSLTAFDISYVPIPLLPDASFCVAPSHSPSPSISTTNTATSSFSSSVSTTSSATLSHTNSSTLTPTPTSTISSSPSVSTTSSTTCSLNASTSLNTIITTYNHTTSLTNSTCPTPSPFRASNTQSASIAPGTNTTVDASVANNSGAKLPMGNIELFTGAANPQVQYRSNYVSSIQKRDFPGGTPYDQYIFFSFEVGDITPAAEVFISFTATPVGELQAAYANFEYLAFSERECHDVSVNNLVGDGDILTINRCTLKTGTWIISVVPKPQLRCLNVTGILYSPEIEEINASTPQTQHDPISGELLYSTQINFYTLASTYTPGDQLSLRVFIDQIQGGQLQLNLDLDQLPYDNCDHDVLPKYRCNAIIGGCIVTVPFCSTTSNTYYIAVKGVKQFSPAIPISYVLHADWAEIPDPVIIDRDVLVTGEVVQAQYMYYQFSTSGVGEMSWLDIHLYVDAEALGNSRIDLFVGYHSDSVSGSIETSDCQAYYKSCSVSTTSSCSVQLTSCDVASEDIWNISVFGNEAPFESVGSLPFTILVRTKIAIPLGSEPPSQKFLSSRVYNEMYDQYHVEIAQGELYIVTVEMSEECENCALKIYFATNSLAGDSCTAPCYYSYAEHDITPTDSIYSFEVSLCSGLLLNEQIYIGIEGKRSVCCYDDPIDYSIHFDRPTSTLTPLLTLEEGSPPVYHTLVGNASQNYTIVLGDPVNDKYLVLYVFMDADNDYSGELSLSLFQGYENYLYCPGNAPQTCTMNSNTSYCSIVIPYCEYHSYGDLTYVQVEQKLRKTDFSSPSTEFGIGYYTRPVIVDLFTLGDTKAGVLMQHTYHHYTLTGEIAKTLIIELYVDNSDPNVDISLFASTKGLAGTPPCFTNDYICRSTFKCVYVVNACDSQEISYFLSVYTDSHVSSFLPLQYTITARSLAPVIELPMNSAVTERLHDTQKMFFTISYDSHPTSGQYSYILVSSVTKGNISISLAPTSDPLSTCPCFNTGALGLSTILAPSEPTTILPLPNCILGLQNFTVLVQEVLSLHEDRTSSIEFTIGVSSSIQPVNTLYTNTSIHTTCSNREYQFYSYTSEPFAHPVVELEQIQGGILNALFSTISPPSASSCDSPETLFSGASRSTEAQLAVNCNGIQSTQYISVYGETPNHVAGSVSFTMAIMIYPTFSITLDYSALHISLQPRIYSHASIDTSSLFSGDLSNTTVVTVTAIGEQLKLQMFENDICSSVLSSIDCTGLESCSLSIPYCILQSGEYIVSFYTTSLSSEIISVKSGASDLSNENIDIPALPYQSSSTVILPMQWKSFSFDSPLKLGTSEIRPSVTVHIVSDNPEITTMWQHGTYASSYPCQMNNCTGNCTFVLNSCCIQSGVYFLSLFNPAQVPLSFFIDIQVSWITQEGHLELLGEEKTTKTLNQIAILSELQYETPIVQSRVSYVLFHIYNATEIFSVYLQSGSYAGPNDNPWFSEHACLSGYWAFPCSLVNECLFQFFVDDGLVPGQAFLAVNFNSTANPFSVVNETFSISYEFQAIPPSLPLINGLETNVIQGERILKFYSLVISSGNAFEDLVITISVDSGNVDGYFQSEDAVPFPGIYGSAYQCQTNGTKCQISYNLCKATGNFLLAIENQYAYQSNYTIMTQVISTERKQLEIGISQQVNCSTSTEENFSLTIPPSFSHHEILIITFFDIRGNITALWTYSESNFCFSASHSVYCREGSSVSCDIILSTCSIHSGEYIIRVRTAHAESFSVIAQVQQPDIQSISTTQLLTSFLSIPQNEQRYYSFNLTQETLMVGHGLEISIEEFGSDCGSISMFVNLDSIASPDCNIGGNVDTLTLSWCDIINQNLFGEYFVTLRAEKAPYVFENVDVYGKLTITTTGDGFTPMRNILPNQKIVFNPFGVSSSVWFVMGVDSLDYYSGDTVITFTAPQNLLHFNKTSLLFAGFDFVNSPFCSADSHLFRSCEVKPTEKLQSCSITISSCEMSKQKFLYVGVDEAPPDSSLVIEQIDAYVKYLSFYNLTAIIEHRGEPTEKIENENFDFLYSTHDDDDEPLFDSNSLSISTSGTISTGNREHFFVDLVGDHIARKKLYLTITLQPLSNFDTLYLHYAPTQVPSSDPCTVESCSISPLGDELTKTCSIEIDYCTFNTYPGIFLSVSGSRSAEMTSEETFQDDWNILDSNDHLGLSSDVVTYQLNITATVEPTVLEPHVSVCAAAASENFLWFTYNITSLTLNPTIHSFKVNVNEAVEDIIAYGSSQSIASSSCFEISVNCPSNAVTWITWDCTHTNEISIAIESTIYSINDRRTSPFTIEWIPEEIRFVSLPANGTAVQYPSCCNNYYSHPVGQYFQLDTSQIGELENFYLLIHFYSDDPTVELFGNIDAIAGASCYIHHCTGSCSLMQACSNSSNDFFLHVTPTIIPYSLSVSTIPLKTLELQIGIPVTHSLSNSNPLNIYALDLSEIESYFPSSLLFDINGVSSGSIDIWINRDIYGDEHCALQVKQNITSSVTILIQERCAPLVGSVYFISIAMSEGPSSCIPIWYNFFAALKENNFAPILLDNSPNVPGSWQLVHPGMTQIFAVNIDELYVTLDSVLYITVTGIEERFITAHVEQIYPHPLEKNNPIISDITRNSCYDEAMEENEIFILSTWLRSSTFYIHAVGLQSISKPGQQYYVGASLINSDSLTVNEPVELYVTDPSTFSSLYFYSVHNVSKFGDAQSFSMSVNVLTGTSVDAKVFFIIPEENFVRNLLAFTCFAGDCVIPFSELYSIPERSSLGFFEIVLRVPYSHVVLSVWQGYSGNCVEHDISLCPASENILKFGNLEGYDRQVYDVYYQLYEKFYCPSGCSCEPIKQACNESLIAFACASVLPICSPVTGFKQSMCRSLCTSVEDSCLVTWAEVGLPRYNCASNFYSSCNSTNFNPFNRTTSGGIYTGDNSNVDTGGFSLGNLPKGAIISITLICFVLLIILLASGYAIVQYIEKKHLKMKEIDEANEPLLYLEEDNDDEFVSYSVN